MATEQEVFNDCVTKMYLKYINQTKDEMLRSIEEEKETNRLHDIRVVISSSIANTLVIPSPNTEEDVEYMEKLGFTLHKDKDDKYHVDLDKYQTETDSELFISRLHALRKSAANIVMKAIREAMIKDENKVTITPIMIDKQYKKKVKYFPEWLSPELERAGFNTALVDDNYLIYW